jgi:hypothetical protein|tara:strand:+ start:5510 stop:5803 length:294 start_codon:yes stop_codon:yes gene_type:complete
MRVTRKQLEAKAKELGVEIEIELGARRGTYDSMPNELKMDFPYGKVFDQLHWKDFYWEPWWDSTASIYEEAYFYLLCLGDCPQLPDCEVCEAELERK